MKPSAEEIAQRVDAIAPVLAANAEACVQARSGASSTHATRTIRHPILTKDAWLRSMTPPFWDSE